MRGIRPMPPKKRYRDSEDSQTTAVSSLSEYQADWVPASPHANDRRDVATQTTLLDVLNMNPSATSRQPGLPSLRISFIMTTHVQILPRRPLGG
ncbi:uncharacterized protein LACBIDRAFT_296974 [Laccaria bicolor S238N-H82]|uniref:Predicted protein n=1 Tax=Laccaria bicolor (strain S238N-H82 / ATCC MYA-4686) TaxID=486041 RepID=B0D9P3_LACBS|nr:uncharacterized protein LACBIDRAFT_296974 [Laccaria bicolor S238N-H82]EDR08614.1 predicted protein [Laccaria bicolor S238N-H82]|eukprot:XP_001880839.1 predicted protein [Laccaria bicolor S238N-H82]